MRRLGLTMVLLSLALVSGCATSGPFKAMIADPDPFRPGEVHYLSSAITVKNVQLMNPSFALLQVHSISNAAAQTWMMTTHYTGSDWLFVEELKFVIDGEVYEFPSEPNPIREVGSGDVTEKNRFLITGAFLNAFTGAGVAAVRLQGQHYYVGRDLSPEDIHNIGWFRDYVRSVVPEAR